MEETFPLIKEAGYIGICITGEPEYYPKHGFKTCDNFGITDAEGNNFDALMGLELIPGGFQNIKGRLVESDIFEQCSNYEAVEEFNKLFPAYQKYQVPSQWLHREKLGKIIAVEDEIYQIAFWENVLPAVLKDSFHGQKPQIGSIVTFDHC